MSAGATTGVLARPSAVLSSSAALRSISYGTALSSSSPVLLLLLLLLRLLLPRARHRPRGRRQPGHPAAANSLAEIGKSAGRAVAVVSGWTPVDASSPPPVGDGAGHLQWSAIADELTPDLQPGSSARRLLARPGLRRRPKRRSLTARLLDEPRK